MLITPHFGQEHKHGNCDRYFLRALVGVKSWNGPCPCSLHGDLWSLFMQVASAELRQQPDSSCSPAAPPPFRPGVA